MICCLNLGRLVSGGVIGCCCQTDWWHSVQLLCSVIASCLGSGSGAQLGRQSRLAAKVHSGCVVRTIGGTPGIAVMP